MTMDMTQFLQTFFEESFEGLEIMESGLLDLDVGAADSELVNSIFRAAHSIKGGSATFGLGDIASYTHVMETLLDELRDGRREVSQSLVDLLLKSVDCLQEMLSAHRDGAEVDLARVDELQQQMSAMLAAGDSAVSEQPVDGEVITEAADAGWHIVFKPHINMLCTGNDPVRILRELEDLGELKVTVDISRLPALSDLEPSECFLAWTLELTGGVSREALDDVFAWVEDECDLEITPLMTAEEVSAVSPVAPVLVESSGDDGVSGELLQERRKSTDRRKADRRGAVGSSADGGSIRVNIDKVDAVIDLVGELIITQSMLSTLGEDFHMGRIQSLLDGLGQLERNSRELQESVMRMRMLPIGFVFNRFPRMIRDLNSQLGKEVELVMSGQETELDKTVTDKIGDPLVHLVRNSLDHGIETPEERLAAGKTEPGTVTLNAYHQGGNIVIEVADNGRGLDRDKILAKAVERGLVSADAQMDDSEVYKLIFMPGFSTAQVVSDVSGRGVGMDVVRRNIQSLGGKVDIESELGKGTCITVRLPLTLAILDGQSVLVGDETYIIPLVSIIESMQVKPGMVNYVAGKGETFLLRNDYLPIIRLHNIFNTEPLSRDLTEGLLVVVESDGKRIGLFVDDLLGQQQVVIKSMESNYQRVDGISGATILGDGSVALIMDIGGLIQLNQQSPGVPGGPSQGGDDNGTESLRRAS